MPTSSNHFALAVIDPSSPVSPCQPQMLSLRLPPFPSSPLFLLPVSFRSRDLWIYSRNNLERTSDYYGFEEFKAVRIYIYIYSFFRNFNECSDIIRVQRSEKVVENNVHYVNEIRCIDSI